MTDLLDNPVWSALAGPHAGLATGGTQARHYPRDMAPFSAIANATAAAYAELAHDLAPGIEARLFRLQPETPPPGWEVVSVRPILQMTASEEAILGEEAGIDVVTLGADDVPEMRELAEITKPGPFGERTSQLGTYIGIRHAGRLVAMAGERMKLPGHAEISAVCNPPRRARPGLRRDAHQTSGAADPHPRRAPLPARLSRQPSRARPL